MKWERVSSGRSTREWKTAWWLTDSDGYIFVFEDGEDAYVMTLHGRKGYFVCAFDSGSYVPVYGPFKTLKLAKLTYEMVARAQ